MEKFVKKYIAEHGAPKSDDLDAVLADVYKKFEETEFSELGGKTPVSFYESGVDNYGLLLKRYFDEGLGANDYLIDAAVKCGKDEDFLFLLDETLDEDVVIAAIDILDKKNSKLPFDRYVDLLFNEKTDPCIVDKIAEVLYVNADDVADAILSRLDGVAMPDSVFAEILSGCSVRRDGVKKLLLSGLKTGDRVAEYCSYLVRYGDESVVKELEAFRDCVDDYVSFKELDLAIEALGGVSDRSRDFEEDLDYIKIKEAEKAVNDVGEDKN